MKIFALGSLRKLAVAAIMVVAVCWSAAMASFNIATATWSSGDHASNKCSWDGTVLTVNNGANIAITGTASNGRRVEVAGGATASITLNGVSMTMPNISGNATPLALNTGAYLTLTIAGNNNTLTGGVGYIGSGIYVPVGASLIIDGTGSLTATGGSGAGIGGATRLGGGGDVGTIIINNGTITAVGGVSDGYGGAGIGRGAYGGGGGGTVIINDGRVIATGGGSNNGGAGIGGGSYSNNSGTITINGGTITATGGAGGWGRGAGIGGHSDNGGGIITINGGTITATGINGGAGIGGGSYGAAGTIAINGGTITATGSGGGVLSNGGAGIGSGYDNLTNGGTTISISIRGGTVTATGGGSGTSAGAGIGGNGFTGVTMSITISGGTVMTSSSTVGVGTTGPGTATLTMNGNGVLFTPSLSEGIGGTRTGGILFLGTADGVIYGASVSPTNNFTIPTGRTLPIASGRTLTVRDTVTLTNNGTVSIAAGGSLVNRGTIVNNGTINYEGTIDNSALGSFINNKGALTGGGTVITKVTAAIGKTYGDAPFVLELPGGTVTGCAIAGGEEGGESVSDVVSVDNCIVTILKAGSADVAVTVTGDGYNYGVSASVNVTVKVGKANQTAPLVITPVTGKAYGDAAFQLEATGGNGTGAVTYSRVSGPGTVTADGVLTIAGVGDIIISAAKAGDENYNGPVASANATVTIVKGEQSALAVTPVDGKVYGDAAFQLATTGGDGTGAVTYLLVSGPGTVTSGGLVTIIGAGDIVVNATKAGDSYYNGPVTSEDVTITVAKAEQAAPLVITPVTGKAYGDAAFQLAAPGGGGTGAVTYSLVSGPGTVTPEGLVTITGVGDIIVNASKAGDDNYNGPVTSENATVTIVRGSQSALVVTPVAAKTYGDAAFQLATTGGSGTGAVSYTVVSGPGTVKDDTLTVTGAGSIIVNAAKAGDNNYNGPVTSANVTITVVKANQTAPLVITPVDGKVYGDATFQLAATGGDGTGAVTYQLMSGPGTVTSGGLVTVTGAGSIIVYAEKAGDNNYNGPVTSANVTITVAKAEQAAPQSLGHTNVTVMGAANGTISGVTTEMEYRLSTAAAYANCPGGTISNLAPGTYLVRYRETANNLASADVSLIILEGTTSVLTPDRSVPAATPETDAAVVAPVSPLSAEFTAGPNVVRRGDGIVTIYRVGAAIGRPRSPTDNVLTVYDASGNVINKLPLSDDAAVSPLSPQSPARRAVGRWDLRDAKGRAVSEGTYLLRGAVRTAGGKRERVSLMVSVR